MEQRIGSITPSVPPAGLDPAHIPGLTPPRSDADEAPEAAAAIPEQAEAEAPEEPEAAEKAEGTASEGEAKDADADAAEESATDGDDSDEDEAAAPDFEVSDRRGAIVADKVGVRFRLDEEEAEFRWDEIAAVEIDTPRFGRRFSVTVYTPERRWYDAQVEATSRGLLKEWTAKLEAVLDLYFDDDAADAEEEPDPAVESADATEEPDPTPEVADAADEDAADAAVEPDPDKDSAEPAEKS